MNKVFSSMVMKGEGDKASPPGVGINTVLGNLGELQGRFRSGSVGHFFLATRVGVNKVREKIEFEPVMRSRENSGLRFTSLVICITVDHDCWMV